MHYPASARCEHRAAIGTRRAEVAACVAVVQEEGQPAFPGKLQLLVKAKLLHGSWVTSLALTVVW